MTELSDVFQAFTSWRPGILELFKPLSIAGVEVTQAIQYCRAAEHLTDKNDRGPDNSLTLVADKPAMVRVYVHGGLQDVPNVSGTVVVQRRKYGIWVDAGTLAPIVPTSITAFRDPPYASERGSLCGLAELPRPWRRDARRDAAQGARRAARSRRPSRRHDGRRLRDVAANAQAARGAGSVLGARRGRQPGQARGSLAGRLRLRVRVDMQHLAGVTATRRDPGRARSRGTTR